MYAWALGTVINEKYKRNNANQTVCDLDFIPLPLADCGGIVTLGRTANLGRV